MGRSNESKQIVKRRLEDYHLRNINTPEIFHAMDRAQQDLATRYDLIRKQITLNTIADQANYDVVATDLTNVSAGSFVTGTLYQITVVGTTDFTAIGAASNNVGVVFTATGVGSGTGVAQKAYRVVKKIKSMQVPSAWVTMIWHYTDQQWDELLETQPSVSIPQYVIYRNDLLTFHGAPTTDDESVLLQTYLHTAIQNLSSTIEPVIPMFMDSAMEEFAVAMLLPDAHPQKQYHMDKYELIAAQKFAKEHNKVSKPIVPRARW
jgi:hypothetical protein